MPGHCQKRTARAKVSEKFPRIRIERLCFGLFRESGFQKRDLISAKRDPIPKFLDSVQIRESETEKISVAQN